MADYRDVMHARAIADGALAGVPEQAELTVSDRDTAMLERLGLLAEQYGDDRGE